MSWYGGISMKGASRAAVAVVAAVVILAGCGGSDGDDAATSTTESTEAAPTTAAPTTTAPTTTSTTEVPTTEAARVYEPTDVLMALSAAELDVPNRRDNTDGQCGELPCSEWITSDILTIAVWNSAEDATSWAEGREGQVLLVGETMTVTFAEGGSTPEYDRDAYTAVIESL